MKALVLASIALIVPAALSAQDAAAIQDAATQDAPPTGYAALEAARSRQCVGVIARMDDLNTRLQPLGLRAERIRMLAQAIALEDRDAMDDLDQSDDLEAAVHQWFVADGRLAQSYVDSRNEDVNRQRTVAREEVKTRVQGALTAVQTEAQGIMESSGDLGAQAARCDGAIFIRPVVVEACLTQESPICEPARSEEPTELFRFVGTPEDLWDVQQLRPWSQPGPLQIAPDGSLGGARSIALARYGNIVLQVTFAPLIQARADVSAEHAQRMEEILDSIGFAFDHPDLIYAPSLAVTAMLEQPLADEDAYVLHFGDPEDADVVWTGPAGTGSPLEAPVILEPRHIVRLTAGETLHVTAVKEITPEDNEALFSLDVTTVGQAQAVRVLLGYMSGPMVEDLKRLVPPGGGA